MDSSISFRGCGSWWLVFVTLFLTNIVDQTSCSGVFQVRLEADMTRCTDCGGTFRLCLGHYQASAEAVFSAIGRTSNTSQPVCSYGTLVTRMNASSLTSSSARNHSNTVVEFPFEFRWPGAFTLVVESSLPVTQSIETGTNNTPVMDGHQRAVSSSRVTVQESVDAGEDWQDTLRGGGHTPLDSLLVVSYRVRCDSGYYGPRCALACNPRQDRFGHYECSENGSRTCLDGWIGKFCDVPICLPGCHKVNGFCEQSNECKCRVGWQGPLCDQCIPYPGCLHGTCQKPWQCTCLEGWGGLFCNQDLNFCSNKRPCRNGATCHNVGLGSYTCTCEPGFTGTNCETDLNGCPYRPCQNNGSCTFYANEHRCLCQSGFAGRFCELAARTCDTNPCSNGATCLAMGGTYRCQCAQGYSGFNCDDNVDECLSNPCLNDGSCVDAIHGYRCSCSPGFTGPRCEVDRDECSINPCLNGGQCIDRPNDFECRCRPGFVGALCQDDIDECLARPCANGATCRQLVNDFRCTCAPGFAGRYCTENVNECASSPCRHGGICIDGVDAFDCRCTPEFVGLVCETPVASLLPEVEWRPVAQRPKGERDAVPSQSAEARSKSEQMLLDRNDPDKDAGATATFNAVQPLLLVASFGLALPIVFVACAFAVWIHRRRVTARIRAETQRHHAAQPEAALNNLRRAPPGGGVAVHRSLVVATVDVNCMQQQQSNESRMFHSSQTALADVVDPYSVDKSMKNNRADIYSQLPPDQGQDQGKGRGQSSWPTTSDRRLDNRLQCRNNVCMAPESVIVPGFTGSRNTKTANELWMTVSSSEVPASVCRDVISAADVARFRMCQMCALSVPLTCACSVHGASYQVAASSQLVGVCHHHAQQQQQQTQQRDQLERGQRHTLATNAELSASFKSTTSATTTGCVEQHELATEV